jgi:3-oxoacyl-[acyl-carrier protein] reductase
MTTTLNTPRRTVLVSGGTRGIGRAIVECLAAGGWNVALSYRSEKALADEIVQTLSERAEPGQQFRTYQVDLSAAAQVRQLPTAVVNDFGGLEGLVNNAGLTDDGAFLSMDPERWQRVLSANFGGTANLTLAAIPHLLAGSNPAVVIVASLAGLSGKEGQVSYATSKGALVGLTQWLGRRFGPEGLRVNAVAPGFIRTEMVDSLEPQMYEHILHGTALGRMGDVEEVARAVSFLLDPGYLQATTLRVDGGFKR